MVPSTEVSIRYLPVDELPGSPQVFDGSTLKALMFTFAGSLMSTCLAIILLVGVPASSPVVLPQPVPCALSIAYAGPQPGV